MAALLREVQDIGTQVSGLNDVAAAAIAAASRDADATDGVVPVADVATLTAQVGGLADRARQVSITAREQEFPEIASQTHALNQKLLAMQQKILSAAQAAGTGPTVAS
jgi:hypothetical protein